ncbi:hypothetical protein [Thermogutta sp.]|uniref:hypothetical protein n=1 Tax=Thermogutta sp. TaxID=1962930 RepID=UPI003220364F
MRKLKDPKVVVELVRRANEEGKLCWVRYCNDSPTRDIRRTSLNHATGRPEGGTDLRTGEFIGGLSVIELQPLRILRDCEGYPIEVRPDWDRISGRMTPEEFITRRIGEYAYAYSRGYILTGPYIGEGSDGEPLVGRPREILAELDMNFAWDCGEKYHEDMRRS